MSHWPLRFLLAIGPAFDTAATNPNPEPALRKFTFIIVENRECLPLSEDVLANAINRMW